MKEIFKHVIVAVAVMFTLVGCSSEAYITRSSPKVTGYIPVGVMLSEPSYMSLARPGKDDPNHTPMIPYQTIMVVLEDGEYVHAIFFPEEGYDFAAWEYVVKYRTLYDPHPVSAYLRQAKNGKWFIVFATVDATQMTAIEKRRLRPQSKNTDLDLVTFQ